MRDAIYTDVKRLLADILIAYLETELCLLKRYGLPGIPDIDHTISTSDPFSSLIEVPFPMDVPYMVNPSAAPLGWEHSFNHELLSALSFEKRHFASLTDPYSVPPVGFFTPLREVVDPTKPDSQSAEHLLNLPQPEMFCADANDEEDPMIPVRHGGWEKFAWNGEKHSWNSETIGARITVDILVNAGR